MIDDDDINLLLGITEAAQPFPPTHSEEVVILTKAEYDALVAERDELQTELGEANLAYALLKDKADHFMKDALGNVIDMAAELKEAKTQLAAAPPAMTEEIAETIGILLRFGKRDENSDDYMGTNAMINARIDAALQWLSAQKGDADAE